MMPRPNDKWFKILGKVMGCIILGLVIYGIYAKLTGQLGNSCFDSANQVWGCD